MPNPESATSGLLKNNFVTQALKAIYDGKVFRPEEPVKIPAHSSVNLLVSEVKKKKGKPHSFFRLAASLKLKGPKDWSENLDDYLYRGKPTDVPGLAFTKVTPMEGGPFVTLPSSSDSIAREPRVRFPENAEPGISDKQIAKK